MTTSHAQDAAVRPADRRPAPPQAQGARREVPYARAEEHRQRRRPAARRRAYAGSWRSSSATTSAAVRLHTDRDAGHAHRDAGRGRGRGRPGHLLPRGHVQPGTADGQRLLAHELLHTVQNPHGLGALRAGPRPGRGQPAAAGDRARGGVGGAGGLVRARAEPEASPRWRRGRPPPAGCGTPPSTPTGTGWSRSTRRRSWTGWRTACCARCAATRRTGRRVRAANWPGWPDELQDAVLDRLEVRLLSGVRAAAGPRRRPATGPVELRPAEVPLPETDLFELLRVISSASIGRKRAGAGRRTAGRRRARGAEESRARDEERGGDRSRARADAAAEEQEAARRTEQEDEQGQSLPAAGRAGTAGAGEQAPPTVERADEAADERTQGQAGRRRTDQGGAQGAARAGGGDPEQAYAPGADKRKRRDDQTKPADGSRQSSLIRRQKARPGPYARRRSTSGPDSATRRCPSTG